MSRQAARLLLWGVLLGSTLRASPAQAAAEEWLGLEGRVPIREGTHVIPHEARWITELRFGGVDGGLNHLLVRAGPSWNFTSWFRLNLNAVALVEKVSTTEYEQQFRAEIEPNFIWRFGAFQFADRSRLERRWQLNENDWIYRNQLRINFRPLKAVWIPFISEELFVSLDQGGIPENRASVGVAWFEPRRLWVEIGYIWRVLSVGGERTSTNVVAVAITYRPEAEYIINFCGW